MVQFRLIRPFDCVTIHPTKQPCTQKLYLNLIKHNVLIMDMCPFKLPVVLAGCLAWLVCCVRWVVGQETCCMARHITAPPATQLVDGQRFHLLNAQYYYMSMKINGGWFRSNGGFHSPALGQYKHWRVFARDYVLPSSDGIFSHDKPCKLLFKVRTVLYKGINKMLM